MERRQVVEERVRVGDRGAAERLALCLQGMLLAAVPAARRPLVVCVGSDRSTGDALGPLVGTLLAERHAAVDVCGTLDEPVHAQNLDRACQALKTRLQPVIAVDASLGKPESIGVVIAGRGPLRPGAGVNKILPPFGDIAVTGTVNVGGFMEYLVLQNTRLSIVMRMARLIADGISLATACAIPYEERAEAH